jgi:riboflavin kinase/FMN adenylyltransferase
MRVFRSIQEIPYQDNSYITTGTFDGIHLGHRKIIEELVWKAEQKKCRCVLVTFFPHPQTVVRSRKVPIELLTPLDEKLNILEESGLDVVLVVPFTQELARTDPKTFVKDILIRVVGIR